MILSSAYVAMTRAKRLLWLSAAQNGPFNWSMVSDQGAINNRNNLVTCLWFNCRVRQNGSTMMLMDGVWRTVH